MNKYQEALDFVKKHLDSKCDLWNEEQIKLKDVLACFDKNPLFGNKRSKTHWLVFIKERDE